MPPMIWLMNWGSGVSEPVPGFDGSGQNTSCWPPGVSCSSIGSQTSSVQFVPAGCGCCGAGFDGPQMVPVPWDSGVGQTTAAFVSTDTGWPGVAAAFTWVLTPGEQPE